MLTKRTKFLVIFAVLFCAGSLLAVFFMWQYIQNEGEKLVQQTKEIVNFSAREQLYRELSSLVDSTQLDREELETYVLTEKETIDFLADVEQMAVEQGVELTTNSLQVTEGEDLFDTLIISYSVEGRKERVDATLLLLETLPYNSFVSNVSLSYLSEGVAAVKGSIELTISLLNYDR